MDIDIQKLQDSSLVSGSLKFSTDYVSKVQLYDAITKLVKEDVRFQRATIRFGGNNQLAVDFAYKAKDYDYEEFVESMKAFAKKHFHAKALSGWDICNGVILIK